MNFESKASRTTDRPITIIRWARMTDDYDNRIRAARDDGPESAGNVGMGPWGTPVVLIVAGMAIAAGLRLRAWCRRLLS